MEKGPSAGKAGQVLLAAYPGVRQREHAARWLGWIAYHMGDRASFRARSVTGWVARRWLGLVGFLRALPVIFGLAAAIYFAGLYLGDAIALLLVIFPGSIIAVYLALLLERLPGSRREHGGWLSTRPTGLALPLRWVRFGPLLADASDRGVLTRTGSAYTFADPATAAALAAPYHARDAERARRTADKARERAALAEQPGARSALIAFLTKDRRNRLSVDFGVGATVLAFRYFPLVYNALPRAWLSIVGRFMLLAAGLGVTGALVAWLALPLTHRLAGWSLVKVRDLSRVRELAPAAALIVAAAGSCVLVFSSLSTTMRDTPGPRWQIVTVAVVFAVWLGTVQALLYAGGMAQLRQVIHGRLLTPVLAAAAAGALAFPVFPYVVHDRPDKWFFVVCVFAITMAELGTSSAVLAGAALELLRRLARWSLPNIRGLSRRGLLVTLGAAAAAAVALVVAGGTLLANAAVFILPAACVAACGLWGGILAVSKTRAKARWLRLPDAIGVAATAATLLALTEHHLLTAVPAWAWLVPVAIGSSIRIWLATGLPPDRPASRSAKIDE